MQRFQTFVQYQNCLWRNRQRCNYNDGWFHGWNKWKSNI